MENFYLPNGDYVYINKKALIVKLNGKRGVLSTSVLNGGYREDLKFLFNYDCKPEPDEIFVMEETYEKELIKNARNEGLTPEFSTGISTGAQVCNTSKVIVTYKDIHITVLTTAGIDKNGGRSGDIAPLYEESNVFTPVPPSTINTIILIDADMPAGSLGRALITATEAKTVAIQELKMRSCYSNKLATGSGTDGTIICCNKESKLKFTNAGNHTKLGEFIGKAVTKSVTEALFLQTKANTRRQKNIVLQLKRFNISKEDILKSYCDNFNSMDKKTFNKTLQSVCKNDILFSNVSMYLNFLDDINYGFINKNIVKTGNILLLQFNSRLPLKTHYKGKSKIDILLKNLTLYIAYFINDKLSS